MVIEILPESEPGALAVIIIGAMTEEDRQTLDGELHLRADRDEDFDLILEMRDAEGLDAGTIRQEFELANKFSDDIRRLAVVTDGGAWEGIAAVLGKPIGQALGIEVEHFSDRTAAWRWFFNSWSEWSVDGDRRWGPMVARVEPRVVEGSDHGGSPHDPDIRRDRDRRRCSR